MKKILVILLALSLVAMPLWAACAPEEVAPPPPPPPPEDGEEPPPPPPPPPEPVELTYSNFFPPTNFHSILAEEFCNEIEALTDGLVTFTYYPGGALVPAPETYDGVVEGIADIGMTCLAYTMGRFPACELVDIPHGYPNGWVATKVANDFFNEFNPAEFADSYPLYFHAHGPGIVYTVDKPVRTLEDMEGLVLRSTGVGAKIAEALGASGYAASQGAAYELMSKGTIDGSMTPMEPLLGWNQAEVVNYVTNCYGVGYTTDFIVVMNLDKWNSLHPDIQQVFTEVSEEWAEKHAKLWTYYDIAARDYFLTFEGKEIIELDADEMARWVEAAKSVKAIYMLEKGEMGLPVFDYEDYLNERIAYWSELVPTDEECVAWVEAELLPLAP